MESSSVVITFESINNYSTHSKHDNQHVIWFQIIWCIVQLRFEKKKNENMYSLSIFSVQLLECKRTVKDTGCHIALCISRGLVCRHSTPRAISNQYRAFLLLQSHDTTEEMEAIIAHSWCKQLSCPAVHQHITFTVVFASTASAVLAKMIICSSRVGLRGVEQTIGLNQVSLMALNML